LVKRITPAAIFHVEKIKQYRHNSSRVDISGFNKANLILNALWLILLCQIKAQVVIPAGKRVSSVMDGKLKSIHGGWIPAIPVGMTHYVNTYTFKT